MTIGETPLTIVLWYANLIDGEMVDCAEVFGDERQAAKVAANLHYNGSFIYGYQTANWLYEGARWQLLHEEVKKLKEEMKRFAPPTPQTDRVVKNPFSDSEELVHVSRALPDWTGRNG